MSETERTTMDEWVALFATRDEIAVEYGKLLRDRLSSWPTWIVLNMAIVDRWSESGLSYIKTRAWAAAK